MCTSRVGAKENIIIVIREEHKGIQFTFFFFCGVFNLFDIRIFISGKAYNFFVHSRNVKKNKFLSHKKKNISIAVGNKVSCTDICGVDKLHRYGIYCRQRGQAEMPGMRQRYRLWTGEQEILLLQMQK